MVPSAGVDDDRVPSSLVSQERDGLTAMTDEDLRNFLLFSIIFSVSFSFVLEEFVSISPLFLVFFSSKYVLSLKECFLPPQLLLLRPLPFSYGFSAVRSQISRVLRSHLFPELSLLL